MQMGSNPFRDKKRTNAKTSKPPRNKNKLKMESLEPRSMLSASLGANAVLVQPNVSGTLAPLASSGGLTIYTPAQIRAAYGFTGVSQTGAGQTIAIVDAYGDSTLSSDLHAFDQQFGLSDPKLSVVNETGGTKLPGNNSGWDMEISLDVEWAHAIAPGANILLVEASSANLSDLLSAVNYARNAAGISVVSMSWGASDFSGEAAYNSYFTTPAGHTSVTFVASSGDSGAGASWPAIANNVLAVGGTTLKVNSNGTFASELAWSGSGGGYSSNETEASYLKTLQTSGKQSDPDVAYDADPSTGFYVRDAGNWYDVGGTSAGAPQWSALIALANQGRAQQGKAALSNADQTIFSLSASDFHDTTTGSNGAYKATVGYDVVTGRGTPIANLIVRDLIAATNPTTTATVSVVAVASKSVSSAAEGSGATGVGPTGNDSGSTGSTTLTANADTASSDSNSLTNTLANSGGMAAGVTTSAITSDTIAAKSALGCPAAFTVGDAEDATLGAAIDAAIGADTDGLFADAGSYNLDSQSAGNIDLSPIAMHAHAAIEGLLDAMTSSEQSTASA